MDTLCGLCGDRGSCLCFSWEVLSALPKKDGWDESSLEEALSALQADGYIDVVFSERQGDRAYVLSLRAGGAAYRREKENFRRTLAQRTAFAAFGAVLSFLVGLLLRVVFL